MVCENTCWMFWPWETYVSVTHYLCGPPRYYWNTICTIWKFIIDKVIPKGIWWLLSENCGVIGRKHVFLEYCHHLVPEKKWFNTLTHNPWLPMIFIIPWRVWSGNTTECRIMSHVIQNLGDPRVLSIFGTGAADQCIDFSGWNTTEAHFTNGLWIHNPKW